MVGRGPDVEMHRGQWAPCEGVLAVSGVTGLYLNSFFEKDEINLRTAILIPIGNIRQLQLKVAV